MYFYIPLLFHATDVVSYSSDTTSHGGVEVLAAVKITCSLPNCHKCSLVGGYQRFEGTFRLHIQG
jgi:hypothetical protein